MCLLIGARFPGFRTFDEVASAADIPLEQVEILVMKGLSLGLVKGTIDEIAQQVRQLRHYFGPLLAHIYQLCTPHVLCDVLCLMPMRFGCGLVLAIRCCVEIGASGQLPLGPASGARHRPAHRHARPAGHLAQHGQRGRQHGREHRPRAAGRELSACLGSNLGVAEDCRLTPGGKEPRKEEGRGGRGHTVRFWEYTTKSWMNVV